MKKSLLNLLGVAAISYSVHAYAAGVGGINVESSLGQPLSANIELLSIDKAEKASLVARLASVDAYKSRGLDYPFGNKFKFAIESHANGTSSIHVTSSQAVNDPFVSLLVDVNWASGKLVREFTFLLDPVGYQVEPLPSPVVQTVAPIVAVVPEKSAPTIPVVRPAPVEAEGMVFVSVEQEEPALVGQKPARKATSKSLVAEKTGESDSIKVQRADNLSKLAQQNAVTGVSLERMMVALYRANAKQFDDKNMNRIKTGKILRMPDGLELAAISDAEAKKEIRVQVQDWNGYRQQLASALPRNVAQATHAQVSTGKVSSNVVDSTPVVKESAKEVLKLSKGLAPTEKVVSAGKGVLTQEQKSAAQEDLIAQSKAADEQRGRVALLEKNLKEIQHLAELKTQAAALLPAASAVATPVATSAVLAVSAVSAVSVTSGVLATSAVMPASAVRAMPKPVVPEVTLMDQLRGDPMYLAGSLLALLGLGGLSVALRRRKAALKSVLAAAEKKDFGSETGRIAIPEIPSPDNGDFTQTVQNNDQGASSAKDDDPISEADLFLSFGRDAQAEEILKEALQANPSNEPVKLKLLEIYAKNQNKSGFEKIAKELQSNSNGEAWQQAQSMGKKLDPNNSLYGALVEDAESATMQTISMKQGMIEPSITLNQKTDFDVTANTDGAIDADKTMIFSSADMANAQKAVMDFDVTSTNPSMTVPANMDFDVTAAAPAVDKTLANSNNMIVDVTATHPSMSALSLSDAAPADLGDMEFSLDFPIDPAIASSVKPAEFNLSDISFDLNDTPVASNATMETTDDFNEVATKLDLAKAYQEMGDSVGAREILAEVMRDGNAEQREVAQTIISQLS
ncbi:MAG: hypothetical protein RL358_590 [Pseudomonadota bacterium]|jgi:pilus assembly protein FimV